MSTIDYQNQRARVIIHGAVQGVGFRPFVYRLAHDLKLTGWVCNTAAGLVIEVEGSPARLEPFVPRLSIEKPPASFIQSLDTVYLDAIGFESFEIVASDGDGPKTAVIMPDLATCADCMRELFDPINRRYRYPFINCTNCGPRFSIINDLPYDRPNTTMTGFPQCPACAAEYADPTNRRFHAQPNACPVCGPHVELWTLDGWTLGCGHQAVQSAATAVAAGRIVAVKGLGGFQLIVDARNEGAVKELRRRKHREEKPFAVMYPSLDAVAANCVVSPLEARLLESSQAPIVLLERKRVCSKTGDLADAVAPGNPALGVMLPYTPLHHLLMAEMGFPVVATSGNRSDEPICIEEHDALQRLKGIADIFLVHDRPIARHMDDSVVRVVMGRELVLRRARGYAPLPVDISRLVNSQSAHVNPAASPDPAAINFQLPPAVIMAYGAHQKCAVALSVGSQVIVSQHIGDLETAAAIDALKRVAVDLPRLYGLNPTVIACDMHPDYASTRLAEAHVAPAAKSKPDVRCARIDEQSSQPCAHPSPGRTQHHYAHVLSCMAENELTGAVLGVAWDGTGYGTDGTIWGGEFLVVDDQGFQRVGHLRPFLLPGGDVAVREPRRTALAILNDVYGSHAFTMSDLEPVATFAATQLGVLKAMLTQKLNSPVTTSAGRLFDAVAALIGLRQKTSFEGQAATLLEYAAHGFATEEAYPMTLYPSPPPPLPSRERKHETYPQPLPKGKGVIGIGQGVQPYELDWRVAVEQIVADIRRQRPVNEIAAVFHNSLVEGIVEMAQRIGCERVALTGGCFQNKYLTERTVQRLREAGLRPYWHQRIPPNDGGIALGQVVAAMRGR